ncbi:mitochondrial ribosomal small subunit component [Coemansia sp. RSA 2706]|nr:mitochondrial ribosomal small subunit component [Coemansia sp. RSA 2706]KAJ2310137.1 mitochondrial ribosomal small subunit component [Coemansia sp. RSA 2705]KAJ2317550.1 mitochondrial ribosomal small subunit component [Coemansia sp. RSA 2704]KAJ2318298.1 mitochondrial ribosomal small subunit component [Coemansia sp. RSA 2702]KAJ2357456.1 mitochondrial ribosomal small subunit component [Coemansia sp. RSA 2610]KAJ2732102.1 mitochondrial ribosomal small subunit component [Coemansia sp. Cherry 
MHVSGVALARSVWKGPFFVHFPGLKESIAKGIPIKTMARACTIMPHMIGAHFQVHNGKRYESVRVTEDMVGRKLGEFSHTRKPFQYRLTKNK